MSMKIKAISLSLCHLQYLYSSRVYTVPFEYCKLGKAKRNVICKNASIIAIQCSLMIYKNRNNKNWVPPSVKNMKFPIKMLRENMELQE